jgi:CRP-like cAMP-binding protein
MTLVPSLRHLGQHRRSKLFESFLERDYEPGNLLEEEGKQPNNLYVLVSGEIAFFKKPEAIYDQYDKLIKIKDIGNIKNPKDAGMEHLGLTMGSFTGPSLIGEDSIVFGDKNIFSLITKTKCQVLELPASQVHLP